jgi:hemerythrin superfamily protein
MRKPSQTDVIAVLLDQHAQIRRLFTEVEQRRGQPRREAFEQLVRLLAVHETAEQEVLHPQVRLLVAGGQAIADARLEEERQAKELLAQLDELGPEVDDFDQRLEVLRKAVLDHAQHEEREEFPRLRGSQSPAQLEAMGMAVRVAEATAPTHPHPGVNSLAGNLVAGPMLAFADAPATSSATPCGAADPSASTPSRSRRSGAPERALNGRRLASVTDLKARHANGAAGRTSVPWSSIASRSYKSGLVNCRWRAARRCARMS